MMNKLIFSIFFVAVSAAVSAAQIAQGGTYKLEQAVIAGGGASADSTGNLYRLDGVIGEPVAGTTSSGSTYSVKGGFLSSPPLAPTAAAVSISGRVLNMDGGGLMNARVTLTDPGGSSRTITTGKFGAFRFDDVEAGKTYLISVASRRYTFLPQVVSVTENISGLDFIAQQPTVLN